MPSIAVSAFPPTVRFSGLPFSYNVAYAIFGGATPVLLTLALHANAAAPAYYIAAMALLGCGLGQWVQLRTQPILVD